MMIYDWLRALTWQMWLSASFTSITWLSCVLLLNHLPSRGRWIEKTLLWLVGVGSFGVAMTPFYGYDQPTIFELCMRLGVACYAFWLSEAYWRELPGFDRRHGQRRKEPTVGSFTGKFNRRGASTEKSEC